MSEISEEATRLIDEFEYAVEDAVRDYMMAGGASYKNQARYNLEDYIAELEAESERFTAHDAIERQDDKSPNDTQTDTVVYGKWIPVSERLPEDGEVVWLWDGNNLGMGYYLVSTGQFRDRDTPLRRIKPTHWMPLPTPPEVQE